MELIGLLFKEDDGSVTFWQPDSDMPEMKKIIAEGETDGYSVSGTLDEVVEEIKDMI